ncbi:hypothetical protein [Microcoleus sp. B3-A4]
MNVEPPETLVLIESIVYKSNGFAIYFTAFVNLLEMLRSYIPPLAR